VYVPLFSLAMVSGCGSGSSTGATGFPDAAGRGIRIDSGAAALDANGVASETGGRAPDAGAMTIDANGAVRVITATRVLIRRPSRFSCRRRCVHAARVAR
jgi:hypothetical protein